MKIHPTALVDPSAQLGPDVEIGPYAVLESGVKLGARSRVLAHAVLCWDAEIGEGCEIHMGAVVGHTPQDFSYKGQKTRAVLGNNVIVREHATVHRSTREESPTYVGDGCYLMAHSHVAHDCVLGPGVILANGALLAGHVHIGERALVSGNVVIHQFTRIGKLAILSGGSRFGMDVPPFTVGDGTNSVSGLNKVGLRRAADFTPQDREQLKEAFKILFRNGLELPAALEQLKKFESPAVKYWVEFFTQPSKRGHCRYRVVRQGDAD